MYKKAVLELFNNTSYMSIGNFFYIQSALLIVVVSFIAQKCHVYECKYKSDAFTDLDTIATCSKTNIFKINTGTRLSVCQIECKCIHRLFPARALAFDLRTIKNT